VLVQLSTNGNGNQVDTVVDLGCGTGISTLVWARSAKKVVGVDPTEDMLNRARQRISSNTDGCSHLSFLNTVSSATGLENDSVDIVVCSQSLHWMDPEPTFREIARILRPGGVFAAIDCDWPPTITLDTDLVFKEAQANLKSFQKTSQHIFEGVKQWPKGTHLERMEKSGVFRLTKEILVHNVEYSDATRFKGLLRTFGEIQTFLKAGVQGIEEVLQRFDASIDESLGQRTLPCYFHYRVRLGIK